MRVDSESVDVNQAFLCRMEFALRLILVLLEGQSLETRTARRFIHSHPTFSAVVLELQLIVIMSLVSSSRIDMSASS